MAMNRRSRRLCPDREGKSLAESFPQRGSPKVAWESESRTVPDKLFRVRPLQPGAQQLRYAAESKVVPRKGRIPFVLATKGVFVL